MPWRRPETTRTAESPHDLAAAYALDALDAGEARAFERHAAHCPACRREVDELSAAAAALALAVSPLDPPPELRERVQAGARRRAPLGRHAAVSVAAIAAVALLALGLQHVLARGPGTVSVALDGARGRLVVEPGGRARLIVDALPAAASGRTYEAWIVDRDGAVPAALFRGGGSPTVAELFRRVPHGARVAVTLERTGGVARLHGAPLFRTAAAA